MRSIESRIGISEAQLAAYVRDGWTGVEYLGIPDRQFIRSPASETGERVVIEVAPSMMQHQGVAVETCSERLKTEYYRWISAHH